MKKKFVKVLSLSLAIAMLFTACGNKDVTQDNDKQNQTQNETQNETNDDVDVSVEHENDVAFGTTTVESIKLKYATTSTSNVQIKPFYNVEQTTEFTFHFNSIVEPCKAITVHTDSKCEESSTIYQINDGYYTEDGGLDVVVKPGKPALNSSDSAKGELDNYNWGNAPVYYLSINYDMEATTPTKLAEPIIVPFTIKSDVSIPTLRANITNEGDFELVWLPVEGAVSYNIYEATKVREDSPAFNARREEMGYVGDYLKKVASVDKDTLSYKDFRHDGTDNSMISDGFVHRQNFYDTGSYYITAVDANGNESLFSFPVSGWFYDSQLPNGFDSYYGFQKDEKGYVSHLPETVSVSMKDKSEMMYPINFTKVGEEYGYAIYEYSIYGTRLTGKINYMNAIGEYEDSVISTMIPNYNIYEVENNIPSVPANTVNTIIDDNYANSTIDLTKKADRNIEKKVPYDADVLYLRADLENARITRDGAYVENKGPSSIETYVLDGVSTTITTPNPTKQLEVTTTTTPTKEPDVVTTTTPAPTQVVEPTTTTVPALEPTTTTVPTQEPSTTTVEPTTIATPEPTKEPEITTVVTPTEEPQVTAPTPTEEPVDVGNEDEPSSEPPSSIDSSNFVEEQINSTKDQVEKANQEEVAMTSYKVYAENAEQEYLALNMINREDSISLEAFPNLLNPTVLVDNLQAVINMNPYILSVESYSIDFNAQMLEIGYQLTKEEVEFRQQAIDEESTRLVSTLVNDSMTDEEKVNALWIYLEDNTSYDNAALEYAEQNGFTVKELANFKDSFNTYGIMCNKVGVCSSYGYTFKLLCDKAGIESERVTGYLNGNLPHAWNVVKLDGTWYQLDVTNHKNTAGIPYMLYLTSYTQANNDGWVLDDEYALDVNLSNYYGYDDSKEYYKANGLIVNSFVEMGEVLAEKLNAGETEVYLKASDATLDTQEEFQQLLQGYESANGNVDLLDKIAYGCSDTMIVFELQE